MELSFSKASCAMKTIDASLAQDSTYNWGSCKHYLSFLMFRSNANHLFLSFSKNIALLDFSKVSAKFQNESFGTNQYTDPK